MLLHEDALGESVLVVGGEYGDSFLQDDCAVVEMLIHKMYGASAELHAIIKGLALRLQSGEGWEQGWMDVQDFAGELLHEPRGEQAQVSGKDDQLDARLAQGSHYLLIMLEALESLAGQHCDLQAEFAGGVDAGGIRAIADDDGDLCLELATGDMRGNGEEVGAASGKKYAKSGHEFSEYSVAALGLKASPGTEDQSTGKGGTGTMAIKAMKQDAGLHPGHQDAKIRKELIAGLRGGNAHAKLEEVVKNFPANLRGEKVGLPYSAWQLLEHLRLAQDDIVRFSDNKDGKYKEMNFPDDYWPKEAAPPSTKAWDASVSAVWADRDAMIRLLEKGSLTEAFPWGNGQSLMREAITLIDHNSYHTGELVALRRLLGIWPVK